LPSQVSPRAGFSTLNAIKAIEMLGLILEMNRRKSLLQGWCIIVHKALNAFPLKAIFLARSLSL